MKSIPRCCFLLLLAAFVTLELCALALSWYCAREQVQRELVSDTYLAAGRRYPVPRQNSTPLVTPRLNVTAMTFI